MLNIAKIFLLKIYIKKVWNLKRFLVYLQRNSKRLL